MHKDIKIMIELQRYWQNIVSSKKAVDKNNSILAKKVEELDKKQKSLDSLITIIKEQKNKNKQFDLELIEKDEKLKKLRERKLNLTAEKEIKAIDKEITTLEIEVDDIENTSLSMIEELEQSETEHDNLTDEIKTKDTQLKEDKSYINDKNIKENEIIASNTEKFDSLFESLSPQVKNKFKKLLQSKGDKAVGIVDGEVCSSCNFQIPSALVSEAANSSKLVNCSNCGRYIYKE